MLEFELVVVPGLDGGQALRVGVAETPEYCMHTPFGQGRAGFSHCHSEWTGNWGRSADIPFGLGICYFSGSYLPRWSGLTHNLALADGG